MSRGLVSIVALGTLLGAFAVALLFSADSAAAQSAPAPDLRLSMYDEPDPVYTRSDLRYYLTYENTGQGWATNITITVQLPSNVVFRPYSPTYYSPTYLPQTDARCSESSPGSGTITCALGDFQPRVCCAMAPPRTIVVRVGTLTAGTATTNAWIAAREADANDADNRASSTTTIVEATTADLSVSKQQGVADPVYVGDLLRYYIGFENNGPGHAPNTVIADVLPEGAAFVPEESDPTCAASSDGRTVSCDLGTLLDHTAGIIFLAVRPTTAGTLINSVTIRSDYADPNPSNNSDSATTTVHPSADLTVTTLESADPARPGRPLTYTVRVTNEGPSDATGVVLRDTWSATVPGGLGSVAVATSQGSCARVEASATCQLGDLSAGSAATVTVTLQPRGPGSVTNSARVDAAEHDSDTANNSSSETTTVGPG